MQSGTKIAVPGATGRVGSHVAQVLRERGHDVVSISRSTGVDVVTGEGLADALVGVDAIIDASTGASPDQQAATEFFTASARNLHAAGERAGVQRLVVVSIIGTDRFTAGYGAAKIAHEQAVLAGPIPARIVRAAQFHEFVAQLVDWGRRGDVSYVPKVRTQIVAARTVAEVLVDVVTGADDASVAGSPAAKPLEVAGPREEDLIELARLLVAKRGDPIAIEGTSNPDDPDRDLNESGTLLPGPDAILGGPTFEEWLTASGDAPRRR